MKSTAIVTVALSLLTLPGMAAPTGLRDVPPGHWAAGAVRRVTAQKLMMPGPDGKFHGDKAVTRYELAVVLDRLVRAMEASHKPLSAAPPSPVHLPASTPPAASAALTHLIGNGFLPATSPLVVKSGNKPVTANELADVLSQVTIRLSDRSLPPQSDQ